MKKRAGSRLKRGLAAVLLAGLVVTGNLQIHAEEETEVIMEEYETENLMEEIQEELQTEEEIQVQEEEQINEEEQENEELSKEISGEISEEVFGDEAQENEMQEDIQEDIFADSKAEMQKADFLLTAEKEQEKVRAGEILLYTVWVENTGETELQELTLQSSFEEEQEAVWEDREGNPLIGGSVDRLEIGERRAFYLKIPLTEDRTAPVRMNICASARYSGGEIIRRLTDTVDIIALKAEFQVTNTADRTMAAPGDRIFFQICIRNTGERTLHSILTTEKLQTEGIPVQFEEKEGVTLNRSRTRALIGRIRPGHSFSLRAVVTVPEKAVPGELINQVTVMTKETGEYTAVSEAGVEIVREETEDTEPVVEDHDTEKAVQESSSRPIASNPRTGDRSETGLWTAAAVTAAITARVSARRRQGNERTKTKH